MTGFENTVAVPCGELHEQVMYDPRDGSGPQLVDVMPPENEEVS